MGGHGFYSYFFTNTTSESFTGFLNYRMQVLKNLFFLVILLTDPKGYIFTISSSWQRIQHSIKKTIPHFLLELFGFSSGYMLTSETWQPEPALYEFPPLKLSISITYFTLYRCWKNPRFLQKLLLSSCFLEQYCSLFTILIYHLA